MLMRCRALSLRFGWTYYKSINPVSPILAVVLLGFDILWMFLSIFNYLVRLPMRLPMLVKHPLIFCLLPLCGFSRISRLIPIVSLTSTLTHRTHTDSALLPVANAASALAINTVCRSAFGAGFPLFASQMYAKLGTPGASSLLGGLALVFMPAPFVLYKYGKKIRSLSKNAM